jgi:hypothetical protein
MPIRLNLLAEAHAAEEARRRDPVKRCIWGAGLFIALMLAWSSLLQLRVTLANSTLSRVEGQIGAQTNAYRLVLDNQKKVTDASQKLVSLRELSASRLLYGTFLNSFQKATVDDVQLVHLRTEQSYTYTEGGKSHTNENNVVFKGKPPTATERVLITVEGNDSSANPGDQVPKFKDVLANEAHLKDLFSPTNGVYLKSLSSTQQAPGSNKGCVLFALECRFPDKIR